MENHKNIKYKKKYNKYKNKYYKLTKNKIYGGTIEPTTIATVAGIICLLVGLGYYVYNKNDLSQKIKNFFNLNDNRLKNKIEKLQDEEEQEALKKKNAQRAREEVDSAAKKIIKSDRGRNDDIYDLETAVGLYVDLEHFYKNKLILFGEKKMEVLQNFLESDFESDFENIWYKELSTVLELFNNDPGWQGKKVCGRGGEGLIQTNLCKEEDTYLATEDIVYGIMNLQKKKNEISKKPELHWDFRTRHFYWSDNGFSRVFIKSYPRFGDPTDILIYILNKNGEFEPHKNNPLDICNYTFNYVLPPPEDSTQQLTPAGEEEDEEVEEEDEEEEDEEESEEDELGSESEEDEEEDSDLENLTPRSTGSTPTPTPTPTPTSTPPPTPRSTPAPNENLFKMFFEILEAYKKKEPITMNCGNAFLKEMKFDTGQQDEGELIGKLHGAELPIFKLFGLIRENILECRDDSVKMQKRKTLEEIIMLSPEPEEKGDINIGKFFSGKDFPDKDAKVNGEPCKTQVIQTYSYKPSKDRNYFISQFKGATIADQALPSVYTAENTIKIEINLEIDKSLTFENQKYIPIGIVEHLGGAQGGHYLAYIKKNSIWYKCSDNDIEEIQEDKVFEDSKSGNLVCWAKADVELNDIKPKAIQNTGNKCYFNSLIQLLSNIPELQSDLRIMSYNIYYDIFKHPETYIANQITPKLITFRNNNDILCIQESNIKDIIIDTDIIDTDEGISIWKCIDGFDNGFHVGTYYNSVKLEVIEINYSASYETTDSKYELSKNIKIKDEKIKENITLSMSEIDLVKLKKNPPHTPDIRPIIITKFKNKITDEEFTLINWWLGHFLDPEKVYNHIKGHLTGNWIIAGDSNFHNEEKGTVKQMKRFFESFGESKISKSSEIPTLRYGDKEKVTENITACMESESDCAWNMYSDFIVSSGEITERHKINNIKLNEVMYSDHRPIAAEIKFLK